MDISQVLGDVILMERGVRDLYTRIAVDTKDPETARILKILASESEAHAQQLESHHGTIKESESMSAGVEGLLKLLDERIAEIKEKTGPAEVLREGIEIEKYMEQIYQGLADNYKKEEQIHKSLDIPDNDAPTLSKLFGQIAAAERGHQKMLQKQASRIIEGGQLKK